MKINIPFSVGDMISVDGKDCEIKGLHIFVDRDSEISNVRAYIGEGGQSPYVTLMRKTNKKRGDKCGYQLKTKRGKV